MSAKDINLMDTIEQLKRSFNKLGDFEDCVYLYALKKRFDKKTKRHWEKSHSEISTYIDLRKYLTKWIISLENETVREEQTSGLKSTIGNSKSKKIGEQREV
jgi:hypothetical protein